MVLMWRLTGQHSITIGGRSDGRVAEELENALGPYARWLPITCQLRETYLFSEIASSIKRAFEEASQWQESFSWEQLERERRDESPLHFSVGFEYEKLPGRALDAASCSISFKRLYSYGERFDAKLTCVRQGDTLTAEIHYDERLLSKDDAKRLASLFRQLFLSARSRPDTPIAQLEWLDEEQRQWLLNLNLTEAEYPRDTCVHELFERQAERTPDRIAVVHEQSRLTYGELNRRAELLARGLRGIGVGPETRVALCLDRSTDLIVGLLGILKAGAAYVPFEPDVPQTRLAAMLENADVRVAVTERQHAERFSELTAHVLCVEEFREEACAVADTATKTRVVSGNLAYVIYTSGSTGRPKGVAVEHRQLVNYIHGITRKLELSPDSSFALVSTIAADLGGTVLFPALCNGGTLHVISHERASNPARLGQYFREHQIDCLKIVPSHLSALLDCARPRDVLPLRRLVLGGEALNWRLVERLAELAPECRVMNHYGPTETTIGVLTCVVREEERGHASATVPTGRPLSNTQAYIVDERLRLVPAGVTGELLIGGEGVARGYLNGASLSAEKFIPDAFGRVPGGRVYRTGDLARYLPDGRIEFLGRRDHQVKVRGYRIEMGEIEATLAKHPSVREAAVAALDDTSGNRNLVAFVSARRGQRLDVAALRVFLQDALPHYMVPSRILLLDALPLTPNGKIDRQSLPRLAAEHRDETAPAYVPPGSDAEKIVAAAWKEVLRVEQVGLYDNFFDLGGHSLFIIQVHGRLSEQFKRDFPVMDLFKYTTVSSLAKYLSSSTEEALPASQSQSRADGRRAAMIQRQHRYAV
jgi:amino acid adenylation domain-containing protein